MAESTASAPAKGTVLAGRYRVERVLGEGGMGIVLAAHQIDLARGVALKLLHPSALASTDARARFLREARASAALESDHAVRVLDTGTLEDGSPYMAMERLEGHDLDEVIRSLGGLPVHTAVGCVLQACHAIGEAHARGIVHRDIKPSNLFVARRFDGSERVVVLDFGISKALATASGHLGLTGSTDSMGSPMYMSPERVRGDENVDARSDIWALGAVLYELLTGKPPFEAQSLTTLAAMILENEPRPVRELRPEVDAGLDAVVLRCLSKKPEQRFASVSELVRALTPYGTAERALDVLRVLRVREAGEAAPNSRAETMPAFSETTAPAKAGRPLRSIVRRPSSASIAVVGVLALTLLGAFMLRARSGVTTTAAKAGNPVAAPLCVTTRHNLRVPRQFSSISMTAGPDRALLTEWGFGIDGATASMVEVPFGGGEIALQPVNDFGIPNVKGTRAVGAILQGDVAIVSSFLVPHPRLERVDTTRFVAAALDQSSRATHLLGARTMMTHASTKMAAFGTPSFLGVASVGARIGPEANGIAEEVWVGSLAGPTFERVVHERPSARPGPRIEQLLGANGVTRGFVAFRTAQELYAFEVTPDGQVPPELVYQGSSSSAALIARGDAAVVVWQRVTNGNRERALSYRTLPEGAAQFSPPQTIPMEAEVSSFALAADGDRLFAAWVENANGRKQLRYAATTGLVNDAFRNGTPLDLPGEVLGVGLNSRGAWVVHGGASLGVAALECPIGKLER